MVGGDGLNPLASLSASVVCDVLDAMGLRDRALSSALVPLVVDARLSGPAFCALGRETAIAHDGPPTAGFEIDRQLPAGSILVVDTGGHHATSIFGGNVALGLKRRGCAGVLVDGTLRDQEEWAALSLPAFGRGLTPQSNKGRWRVVDFGKPIVMPGQTAERVAIRPGDWILGDKDGVVVVPREHVAEVADAARTLERVEDRIKQDLERGDDRQAVYARHDRFGHARKVV